MQRREGCGRGGWGCRRGAPSQRCFEFFRIGKIGLPLLSQTKLRLPCNVEPSSHSQDLASVEPEPARPVLFPCAGLSLMPAFLPLEPARFTLLIAPRSSFSPPRPLEPTSLSRRSFVPESPAPRPSLLLCRTRMPRFSAPGFPPV